LPAWIVDLFARYGYAVVFAGVFLENTGLPVPGETALLAGAALAHFGRLSLWHVVVTAIVAAILGDNLGFFIGRRGGRWLLEQYGPRLGVTTARLGDFDRFFDRHGAKTVFVARFITGLRVVGAILAGASGLRWPTFLFYNATGAVVWCTAVAAAGYALANSWDTLERWIGRTGVVALVLAIIVVLIARWRAITKPPTHQLTK
jgi:membrane protein DedA with SNARE-associated domain